MQRHGILCCAIAVCLFGIATVEASAAGTDYLLLTTGWNNYGQLGQDDTSQRNSFTRVADMSNIGALSGGYAFSLVLQEGGQVYGTGRNTQGALGLGNYSDTDTFTASASSADLISAGHYHSLMRRSSDGAILATGFNSEGQLGLGDTTDRDSFTAVTIAATITAISAGGQHSLALDSDGYVWVAGRNIEGQLGLSDNDRRTSFTKVSTPTNIVAISAGAYHSLLLDSNGHIWGSGKNSSGQLGLQDTDNRSRFVLVSDVESVVEISAGGEHSLARLSSGTVMATGSNAQGACGFYEYGNWVTWSYPGNATDVAAISAGYAHSLIRKNNGTAWATGAGAQGQLGLGTAADQFGFAQIPGLAGVAAVQACGYHSLALAPKHIELAAPNGPGVTAERGTSFVITWTSSGLAANAKVNIVLNGGAGNRWTLAAGVPNKGSWLWKVGAWKSAGQDVYPDAEGYRIEVGAVDGRSWDDSDNTFSIGTVQSIDVDGDDEANENSTSSYTCTAHYNAGPDQNVTALAKWRALSPNPKDPSRYQSCKFAVMQPGGQLLTKEVSANQPIRVTATYGKGKAGPSDYMDVTILDLP